MDDGGGDGLLGENVDEGADGAARRAEHVEHERDDRLVEPLCECGVLGDLLIIHNTDSVRWKLEQRGAGGGAGNAAKGTRGEEGNVSDVAVVVVGGELDVDTERLREAGIHLIVRFLAHGVEPRLFAQLLQRELGEIVAGEK